MVVVASRPGSDATLTATISSWTHSLVESGQRPETTNPLKRPTGMEGRNLHGSAEPVSISPPILGADSPTRLWVD